MIFTFQRNRHFRKVLVNKTSTHVQEQKKAMSPRHSSYILSSVKSPLTLSNSFWLQDSSDNLLFSILGQTHLAIEGRIQKLQHTLENIYVCNAL